MKTIYRLFRMDPESRENIISVTSGLGVVINVLIAAAKVVIGLLASSIAIVSEGVNNAADAMTSVLTFLGARLAGRHPDAKHPFGYGRIEYLTGLVISVIILVSGAEMLISSVRLVFSPEELSVNYLSLIILAVSAVIKFWLGMYTIRMGKKADSSALVGVGMECRGDSFASVITIVSAVVFLLFGLNIDAYAGIIISLLILKAGLGVLLETLGDLIGRPGDRELAETIYKEVKACDAVLSAADMMLHNYGPDAWSGSVNVEIDHKYTVGEVYQQLHALQLRIMHEYHVTMVFGIYAVNRDEAFSAELRKVIAQFVREKEHIKSYHAVYIDEQAKTIYCDFIVDYSLRDWDALHREFEQYMAEKYPSYGIELTIETEFV